MVLVHDDDQACTAKDCMLTYAINIDPVTPVPARYSPADRVHWKVHLTDTLYLITVTL